MVELEFVEMYKEIIKTYFSESTKAEENSDIQTLITVLDSSIWNLSDKRIEICQRIVQVSRPILGLYYLSHNP